VTAAIERHINALHALHAHAAAFDHVIDPVAPQLAALEKRELDALQALVQIVPSTVGGYRAVARHLARYGPIDMWPEGVAERMLRAFAGEPETSLQRDIPVRLPGSPGS
jgi:hypothetical protein